MPDLSSNFLGRARVILRLLLARSLPRRRKHMRWADPNYVAAWLVELAGSHDILVIFDETGRSGVPGWIGAPTGRTEPLGRVALATLSSLFGWSVENRRIVRNPCADIHRADPASARDRTLTDNEIVAFWHACDDLGEPIGQLRKLLLLTGRRRTELAGMLWSEIGADGTKILASIKPIAGTYAFTTTGRSPVDGWSKIKDKLDAAMGNPAPWRLHDLRRTFVTGLADLGIRPDLTELAVNHRSGVRGHISGIYNRSELLPERKAALETWANRIERLVVGKSAKVLAGPGLRK